MTERTPEHSVREQDTKHQYAPQKEQGQEETLRQRQAQYDVLRELIDTPPAGATVRYYGDEVDNDNMLRPHQRRRVTYYEISGSPDNSDAQRPQEILNDGQVLVVITQFPAEPSPFINANQAINLRFLSHPKNPSGVETANPGLLLPDGTIDCGNRYQPIVDPHRVENEFIERANRQLAIAEQAAVERITFFIQALQNGNARPVNPPVGK